VKTKNRTPATSQNPEPNDPVPDEPEPSDAESADAEADDAKPSKPSDAEAEDTDKPQQPNGKRTLALALAVVAAVCAAWFGWSWYGAAHDESLHYSSARDEALRAGEQAIQNLNTLDYRSLDEGLKVWQDSSTSQLYQQIVQGRQGFEQAVRKAQTITSAKVLDAAVTELDQHAGKASVIVALQVTVTPPKGEPTVKKTRLMGQLTRTSTGWKLSALAPAPVGSGG
jgi:Mce-associated membrane protein